MGQAHIKIDNPFLTPDELIELVRQFESCELPYECWTHRAHLAVAAIYLARYPFPEAVNHARAGIRQYNLTRGDPAGYHETLTVVFMRLVARELHGVPSAAIPGIVNDLADRWKADKLLSYYSAERLWSAEARESFVWPDLAPLDF